MKKMLLACFALSLALVTFSAQSLFAESATRTEVIEKVQAAVKMAQEKGEAGMIEEINKPSSQFVWKDSYVFALTADQAITVAHPVKPKLIGKNLLHIKDVNGVMLFAEFARIGKSDSGKGWVDYMWPKPGDKTPSSKHSYMEKVPGMNVIMGSGYYE